jgi:hypothetical protein
LFRNWRMKVARDMLQRWASSGTVHAFIVAPPHDRLVRDYVPGTLVVSTERGGGVLQPAC